MAGPNGTPILDTFTAANSTTLSANWTANVFANAFSSWQIVSNQAEPATSGFSSNWWNATSFGAQQEAFVTVAAIGTATGVFSLFVRLTPGASGQAYWLSFDSAHVYIEKTLTGTTTTVLDTIAHTLVNGEIIGISASGTTITAWSNTSGTWNNIGSVTDSSITGGGFIGIEDNNNTTIFLTNFGGGTYPVATSIPNVNFAMNVRS